MNRFIKKNMFLVGVLGISALGVLVLLVLSIWQYIVMSAYIRNTEDMKSDIDKLQRQKPPADERNIPLVQEDIAGYDKAMVRLKNYFGHPLYPALQKFAAKLNLTPEQLKENFKEFWEKEKESQSPRELSYRHYVATLGKGKDLQGKQLWTAEAWEEAMEDFVADAQKTTIEEIGPLNREEIFLSSLGLPRNMGKSQARLDAFARDMQNKVIDLLTGKNEITMMGVYFTQRDIPEVRTNLDFVDLPDGRKGKEGDEPGAAPSRNSGVADMSAMAGGAPGEGQSEEKTIEPADVILHWNIISDLARHFVKAKIDSVEELSYKDMTGREDKGCKLYTYSVSVVGSESDVRNLFNSLSDAYKQHRVYLIRNLSIAKQEDQVQDIIDVAQGILGKKGEENTTLKVQNDSPVNFNGGMGMGMEGGMDAKQIAAQASYFKEEGKYPECVAGRSNIITASFVVDYVVYNGDTLK